MKKDIYKDSGVDIKKGNEIVKSIRNITKNDKNIGMFGGLFSLENIKNKNTILCASCDGVGTKLLLCIEHNNYDSLGQDLVAMNVNDIICQRAKPIFFLDYFAVHKINASIIKKIISSIVKQLSMIDCVLLGGETAEMNDLYKKNHFDIAGFCVGIKESEKENQVAIQNGDYIIGIESSGIHSNGFSYVRKWIKKHNIDVNKKISNTKIIDLLLKPTIIYVNPIIYLISKYKVNGLSHITGGGLVDNIERILPNNINANIEYSIKYIPKIIKYIIKTSNYSYDDFTRIFNMGMGFVLFVNNKKDVNLIIKDLSQKFNLKAHLIGNTSSGKKKVNINWNI